MPCGGLLREKGFSEGLSQGFLRRGVPRRPLEHPVGEYDPLGMCPTPNNESVPNASDLRSDLCLAVWENF